MSIPTVPPIGRLVKIACGIGVLLGIAGSAPAWAQGAPITGHASVLDSDVLQVNGKRILLFGLESVERPQVCTIGGKQWECYAAAVRELETLADLGDVTCMPARKPDIYGRILARCEVNGQSLNEQFVRSGFAVARRDETKDYVAAEEAAKKEKIGLWQGAFMMPWDFRTSRGIMVDRP